MPAICKNFVSVQTVLLFNVSQSPGLRAGYSHPAKDKNNIYIR